MAENNPTDRHSSGIVRWLNQIPLSHPSWKNQHPPPSIIDPWILAIMSSNHVGLDPWDWSIDRVIQELSTTDRCWDPKYPRAMPDASFISSLCKENGIDGSILLNELNEDSLKELIKSLGWRSYVRDAINQLRQLSEEYRKTHQETQRTSRWGLILSDLARKSEEGFSMPATILAALARGEWEALEPWFEEEPGREQRLDRFLQRRKSSQVQERVTLALPSSTPRASSYQDGHQEGPSHGSEGTTLVSDQPASKRQKLDTPTTAAGSTIYDKELPHGLQSSPAVLDDDLPSEAHDHAPSPSSHGKRKRSVSPETKPSDGIATNLLQQEEGILDEGEAEPLPDVSALDADRVAPAVKDVSTEEQLPLEPSMPMKEKKRAVLITIGPPTAEGLANLEAQGAQMANIKQFIHGLASTGLTEGKEDDIESQAESLHEETTLNEPASLSISTSKQKKRANVVRIGSPTAEGLANLAAQRAEVVDINGYIRGHLAHPFIPDDTSKDEIIIREAPTEDKDVKNDSKLPTSEDKLQVPLKASRRRRTRVLTDSSGSYLPRKKMPADTLFYENTEFGQDLADIDDDVEFSFSYPPILPGRARYVNNCMKYSMLYKPQTFEDGDKSFKVVRPYPGKLLYASDSPVYLIEPSCTVFYKSEDGEVYAERGMIRSYTELEKRERELRGERRQRRPGYGWPKPRDHSLSDSDDDSTSGSEDTTSGHDEAVSEIDPNVPPFVCPPVSKTYRGLLHPKRTVFLSKEGKFLFGTTERPDDETFYRRVLEKYSSIEGEDKLLPVFGDSGSENEYEEKFWKELGKEKSEKAMRAMRQLQRRAKKKLIPLSEVSETIDQALAKFEVKWTSNHLPKLEATAWSLWTEARDREILERSISRAENQLTKDNERLEKWRAELMSMEWSSKSQVRKVCGALEQTAFDINKGKWQISTLHAESAPPRAVKQPRNPKKQSTKISATINRDQNSSEDDVDESAALDEDAASDDFVVSDDDDDEEEEEKELDTNADVGDEQDQQPQARMALSSSPSHSRTAVGDTSTPATQRRRPSVKLRTSSRDGSSRFANGGTGSRSSPILIETPVKDTSSSERANDARSGQNIFDLTLDSSPPVEDLVTPERSESDNKKRSTSGIKLRLTHSVSPFRHLSHSNSLPHDQDEMPDEENLPPYDDPSAINRYTYVAWSRLMDADRLLIKAFCGLPTSRRIDLFSYISDSDDLDDNKNKLWSRMRAVVLALNTGKHNAVNIQPDEFGTVEQFLRLFHIFADGHNKRYQPLGQDLTKFGQRNTVLLEVLANLQSHYAGFWNMCYNMEHYFENFDSQGSVPATPSRPRISKSAGRKKRPIHEDNTTDEDEDSEGPISSAKRRRLSKGKAKQTDTGDDEFDSGYTPSSSITRLRLITRKEAAVNPDDSDDSMSQEEGSTSLLKRQRAVTLSDNEALAQVSPHMKRRKQVHQDKRARARREQDREQQSQQDLRRQKLQEQLLRSGRNEDLDLARLIINAADNPENAVRVHNLIARFIKPHQIDGVRFLWNQIVTPSDKDSMQGCLLAHTMGLGKTMQTITLLVAIAEASSSSNPSVSSQIPKSLQVSRSLILCPPSLVDNWVEELYRWVPGDILGPIQKVDTTIGETGRIKVISRWHKDGGVLVLGYSLFRSIAGDRTGKPKDPETFSEAGKQLLQGANIVAYDEAHFLKSKKTALAKIAHKFRTKSRIALTGSPLANNLEEYYGLIDLVAPGYLGEFKEFKAVYMEPIEAGLYEDSNRYERRLSMKMLKVLDAELAPKINRASMLVLKEDMPEKKEFVITVPLTPIQHKAYVLYVRSMLERSAFPQTKSGEVVQTTMWHWLALLSLLCNHPACFKAKLEKGKNEAQKTSAVSEGNAVAVINEGDTEVDVDARIDAEHDLDAPLYKCGISEDVIEGELRLFEEEVKDIDAIELSNKMVLLCQILDAAKEAGDKTLVFSGSIETLNYLSRLFESQKRSFNRLDGKTKASSRQLMTKNFNDDNVDVKVDVFLISTRAGGLGLNLQGANRVVIFDFKFNPSHEEQAVGRAYRIGQTKETYVYRFVAGGTFETSVHNKAIYKLQLASRVIDKRTPISQAKKSLGEFLHEPKYVPQNDLSGSQGKDSLVLDKILAMQQRELIIREIVPTETFNRDGDERLTAEEEKEVKQLSFESNLRRTNPKKWEELQRKAAVAVHKPSTQVPQGRRFSHASRVMPQAMPVSHTPYQTPAMSRTGPGLMGNRAPLPANTIIHNRTVGFDNPANNAMQNSSNSQRQKTSSPSRKKQTDTGTSTASSRIPDRRSVQNLRTPVVQSSKPRASPKTPNDEEVLEIVNKNRRRRGDVEISTSTRSPAKTPRIPSWAEKEILRNKEQKSRASSLATPVSKK